jgi:hypothetical protein
MQRSLLDQFIELIKADYPEDYARFCQLAYEIHRKFAHPEEAARRHFSEACWLYRAYVSGSSEIAKLCEKFFEHLADVARDRGLVGRLEGDPETRPIPTDLITPEGFRFDPDLLVPPTHNGKLIFVDVRVESAAAQLPSPSTAPVRKLSGKMWVPVAFERRRNELLQMSITDASCALHEESKTAPDCAKPLEARYIEKELRALGGFPKANRGSKQRPK